MSSICQRIKLLRKDMGLTQKEFANRIGVTNAHISRIEKELTRPSAALIKLICKTYQVSESWLLQGTEPMSSEDELTWEGDVMQNFSNSFNQIYRSNGLAQILAIQLQELYSDIIMPPTTDETEMKDYLVRCYDILLQVQKFLSVRKNEIKTAQMEMKNDVEDTIKHLTSSLNEMDNFLNRIRNNNP